MEKFGIFELLDALAAITEASSQKSDAPEAPPAQEGPRMPDASSLPPSYGAADPAPPKADAETRAPNAFGDFLARHDRAAERIGKGSRKS